MSSRHHAAGFVLGILLLATQPAGAATESWHAVVVDHVERPYHALILTVGPDQRYVREIDVRELGLPVSGGPAYRHAGEWYYHLRELPEYEMYLDEITSRAHFVNRSRPHVGDPPGDTLLLDVRVNTRRVQEPLLLHFRDNELFLPETALVALGLDKRKVRQLLDGRDELPVHAVAGERFALDYQRLTLTMTVPPELFQPVRIGMAKHRRDATRTASDLSAFLSYDISGGSGSDTQSWHAGLFELAVGSGQATCSSQHLKAADRAAMRRLDSRCTVDWPDRTLSLSLGDAVTRPGTTGQPVRFGGVRIGTDYGLVPAFVTQPTINLLGSARLPSTLEVWVNEMLALRRDVAPGVFELEDIPMQTGDGRVRAVVTNVLGMREVITHSFYSDPQLLAPGLVDWSLEAGRVREEYGLDTDRYGEPFAQMMLRAGLRDWLTVEPRFEASESFMMSGLGGAFRVGTLGLFEIHSAISETRSGARGKMAGVRFSRRGPHLSLSFDHAVTDGDFVQLGFEQPGSAPARRSQASIGLSLPGGASLNVGGFERELHDGERQRFYTAALNIGVARTGSLLITAFRPIEPFDAPLYSASLTIPFGAGSNLSARTYRQADDTGGELTLQKNLPSGPGYGYRLGAGQADGSTRGFAQLQAQGNRAHLRLDGRQREGATSAQAQLSGSMILSRNGIYLSRWRNGSAAIVDLPDGDVRVYHDERLAAITSRDGTAVVPGLHPYRPNRLRIEADDLPMGTDVRSLEMRVTPGRRQAVAAIFDIVQARHVSGRLRQANSGTAVPSGAKAVSAQNGETHPVGLDGFFYMPLIGDGNVNVDVSWPRGRCRAELKVPASREPFIDLGEITCH